MKDLSLSQEEFQFVHDSVKEAGKAAFSYQEENPYVQRKEDQSIVTQADYAVQDLILTRLSQWFPDFNVVHEENFDRDTNNMEDSWSFVVDPIDGTAVYSMGLPTWCVSLGVYRGYEPIYGFVYSPGCNLYFHNDDEHAYCNGAIISAENNMSIDNETSIFTASEAQKLFSYNFPGKLRNLGSTALHAAMVADNKRNRTLAFIGKSSLWDWAGALPILYKADVSVHYLDGSDINIREIAQNRYSLPAYLVAYTTLEKSDLSSVIVPL